MKQQDRDFIEALSIEEIPWENLATPYYRATEFPELLEAITDEDNLAADEAANLLALNLESESILWQATPLAMIFLTRLAGLAVDNYLEAPNKPDADFILRLLNIYAPLFDAVDGIMDDERPAPMPAFADMLKPENLLPARKTAQTQTDETVLGEFYAAIPENLFYSFFHYSWLLLLESLQNDISRLATAADKEVAEAAKVFTEAPLYATLRSVAAD